MTNAPLPLEIDAFGLHEMQTKNVKTVFIDVRMPREIARAPAEGCVNIPLNQLPQHVEQLPLDAERMVVICAHGQRSLMAVRWLRQHGFDAAQSLMGGMASWRRYEEMAA